MAPVKTTVELTWRVENQHVKTFTEQEWIAFVDSVAEMGLVDLNENQNYFDEGLADAIYQALEEEWQGKEVLRELATPGNWIDFGDTEPTDLIVTNVGTVGSE